MKLVTGILLAGLSGAALAQPALQHSLPGFDEILLTGDLKGRLVALRVGETTWRKEIPAPAVRASAIRSRNGLFYILYPDGLFATLDPERGALTEKVSLPVKEASDFLFLDDHTLYVSGGKSATLAKINLRLPRQAKTISLPSVPGQEIEARQLIQIEQRLFVQVARAKGSAKLPGALAVIDTRSDRLIGTVELAGRTLRGEALTGIEPKFTMSHDPKRKQLIVAASGVRFTDTGLIARIDLERLKVLDVYKAEAGYQGVPLLHPSLDRMYVIYHTSTPTTSSHLFFGKIEEVGRFSIVEGQRPLIDTFDGLDALALSPDGRLLAMANTCLTGFCIGGAGINFVDTNSHTVLPKLNSPQLGLSPVFVIFRQGKLASP